MDADISQIIIQLLMGFLYGLPTLAFIIICLYYLKKVGSVIDGILLLIGNSIIFITIILGQIAMIYFVHYRTWEANTYTYITIGNNVLSFIGSILCVVGLFLLVKRVIKNSTNHEN